MADGGYAQQPCTDDLASNTVLRRRCKKVTSTDTQCDDFCLLETIADIVCVQASCANLRGIAHTDLKLCRPRVAEPLLGKDMLSVSQHNEMWVVPIMYSCDLRPSQIHLARDPRHCHPRIASCPRE